jgi:hypothetical protein
MPSGAMKPSGETVMSKNTFAPLTRSTSSIRHHGCGDATHERRGTITS